MSSVVGLDLSLTSTGVALAQNGYVSVGRVRSNGRKGATVEDTLYRLARIVADLGQWIEQAELVVIESPSYGSHTGSQHERGGLWWAVANEVHLAGPRIATVSPGGRAKYATGKGNAGKDAVLAAVVKRYPDIDITGNDTADAVVLAAMGARWLGEPFDTVPQTHLAAMNGASWPTLADKETA